ncbi:transcriptional activator CMR1 [Fusarium sp. NRRL 52700]|nr:transcriptional activator CMR1 [Fusarium sp. NRRL 52700]
MDTSLLVSVSVAMISCWLRNPEEFEDVVLQLHESLMSAFSDWIANPRSRHEYDEPWPFETYQAILMNIIFAFYHGNEKLVSKASLLRGTFVVALREAEFFSSDNAAEQQRVHYPGTFVPWLMTIRDRWKRLIVSLFKIDTYISIARFQAPTLFREEIDLTMPATHSLWNSYGLNIFFKRITLEPTDRSNFKLSEVIANPNTPAKPLLLFEDIHLALCGLLPAIWNQTQIVRRSTEAGRSTQNCASSLAWQLEAWKADIERLKHQCFHTAEVGEFPFAAYIGDYDEDPVRAKALAMSSIKCLISECMMTYHLQGLQLYADPRMINSVAMASIVSPDYEAGVRPRLQKLHTQLNIWAKTPESRRALLHALAVLRQCESDLQANEPQTQSIDPTSYLAISMSALVLTLYRANGSCSLIPHAILRHYKIPFTAVRLKFGPNGVEAADGSFSNAQYRAIHPRGYVPALAVDNEIITEMPAILNYISSLVPEENLFGIGKIQEAKVLEWLVFLSGTLHGVGYGAWLRPGRFNADTAAHDKVRAKGREVIHESFKRIDDGLKSREFMIGNALTVVDFNVYIFARWAHEVEIDLEKEYSHYYGHVRKIENLDGIKEAVENEGLKRATTILCLVTCASSRAVFLVEGLITPEIELIATVTLTTVLGTEVSEATAEASAAFEGHVVAGGGLGVEGADEEAFCPATLKSPLVEEAFEVVELLVVEVLELVIVVELARDAVLVDALVVKDVVEEDTTEAERDVVVADVTLERPAGPPAIRELSDETPEAPDDTVADEGRLAIEDAVTDDSALIEGALEALKTLEGKVLDDMTLKDDELEIDKVVLVVVVEARELVEESVAKVVEEVEAVEREAELVILVLAVEEALVAVPLVDELRAELLELPELERLIAIVEAELPVEDIGIELEDEEEAPPRPPAMLPNTPSEVLKELVELVDTLLETGAEVELLTEPVLVEAPFEVELDTPLEEELPLVETKDDEREALEKLDAAPMLVDATELEICTVRAALEDAATEEPTLLADDKAPIDVGNELL